MKFLKLFSSLILSLLFIYIVSCNINNENPVLQKNKPLVENLDKLSSENCDPLPNTHPCFIDEENWCINGYREQQGGLSPGIYRIRISGPLCSNNGNYYCEYWRTRYNDDDEIISPFGTILPWGEDYSINIVGWADDGVVWYGEKHHLKRLPDGPGGTIWTVVLSFNPPEE